MREVRGPQLLEEIHKKIRRLEMFLAMETRSSRDHTTHLACQPRHEPPASEHSPQLDGRQALNPWFALF